MYVGSAITLHILVLNLSFSAVYKYAVLSTSESTLTLSLPNIINDTRDFNFVKYVRQRLKLNHALTWE